MHYYQGNYSGAQQLTDEGEPLAVESGDVWGMALAHRLAGCTLYDDNRYDEAEERWNSALERFTMVEDWNSVAACHVLLGNAAMLKANFSPAGKPRYRPPRPFFMERYPPDAGQRDGVQTALTYFYQALRHYTMTDNLMGIATGWGLIGVARYMLRDYEAAVDGLYKAADIARHLDALGELAQYLTWLAWVRTWLGQANQARADFHEALRLQLDIDAHKWLLDCLQKYSLFLWVTDREHDTPLLINAFVAQHPNTGARMRVVAEEWLKNISEYMQVDEGQEAVDDAIARGHQQTLAALVEALLSA